MQKEHKLVSVCKESSHNVQAKKISQYLQETKNISKKLSSDN